mgnify:CR=1 FL=1
MAAARAVGFNLDLVGGDDLIGAGGAAADLELGAVLEGVCAGAHLLVDDGVERTAVLVGEAVRGGVAGAGVGVVLAALARLLGEAGGVLGLGLGGGVEVGGERDPGLIGLLARHRHVDEVQAVVGDLLAGADVAGAVDVGVLALLGAGVGRVVGVVLVVEAEAGDGALGGKALGVAGEGDVAAHLVRREDAAAADGLAGEQAAEIAVGQDLADDGAFLDVALEDVVRLDEGGGLLGGERDLGGAVGVLVLAGGAGARGLGVLAERALDEGDLLGRHLAAALQGLLRAERERVLGGAAGVRRGGLVLRRGGVRARRVLLGLLLRLPRLVLVVVAAVELLVVARGAGADLLLAGGRVGPDARRRDGVGEVIVQGVGAGGARGSNPAVARLP